MQNQNVPATVIKEAVKAMGGDPYTMAKAVTLTPTRVRALMQGRGHNLAYDMRQRLLTRCARVLGPTRYLELGGPHLEGVIEAVTAPAIHTVLAPPTLVILPPLAAAIVAPPEIVIAAPSIPTKWCGRGRHDVALELFGRRTASADGLQNWCKECQKRYAADRNA